MMSGHIKFNVIIPTRERADTLYHCLKTVVAQEYEHLSIIVSDNYSQDNTKEIVDSFADPRITYINTGKRVSMTHNWEFALGHVADGWVTFLGDDDGMMPNSLSYLNEVIKQHPVQAICSRFGQYYWRNFDPVNYFRMSVPLENHIRVKDSHEMLSKVMKGYASYFELPWLYLGGFATIDVINKAKDHSGKFFLSRTPDVYSAIALSSTVEKYLLLGTPIVVNGTSGHSNGASFLTGIHKGPAAKYLSEANIPLHSTMNLDSTKSLHILIYECYLQSTHLHGNNLGIQLKHQLATALAKANKDDYQLVAADCMKTCAKNKIDFNELKKIERTIRLKSTLPKLYRKLNRMMFRKQVHLNNSLFLTRDIYDAVIVSHAIRQLIGRNLLRKIPIVGKSLCLLFLHKD